MAAIALAFVIFGCGWHPKWLTTSLSTKIPSSWNRTSKFLHVFQCSVQRHHCRTPRSRPSKATVYKSHFPPLRHQYTETRHKQLAAEGTLNHALNTNHIYLLSFTSRQSSRVDSISFCIGLTSHQSESLHSLIFEVFLLVRLKTCNRSHFFVNWPIENKLCNGNVYPFYSLR